ncbi:unnamed protein product [Arctogadus glacialis]
MCTVKHERPLRAVRSISCGPCVSHLIRPPPMLCGTRGAELERVTAGPRLFCLPAAGGTCCCNLPCAWSIGLAAAPGCLPPPGHADPVRPGAVLMGGRLTITTCGDRDFDRKVDSCPCGAGGLSVLGAGELSVLWVQVDSCLGAGGTQVVLWVQWTQCLVGGLVFVVQVDSVSCGVQVDSCLWVQVDSVSCGCRWTRVCGGRWTQCLVVQVSRTASRPSRRGRVPAAALVFLEDSSLWALGVLLCLTTTVKLWRKMLENDCSRPFLTFEEQMGSLRLDGEEPRERAEQS